MYFWVELKNLFSKGLSLSVAMIGLSLVFSCLQAQELKHSSANFPFINNNPDNAPALLSNYGPVSNNEGLWDIAQKLRPHQDISIEQMSIALFKNNPEAFNPQNMNALLVGAILIYPTEEQIAQLNKKEAFELFQAHWQQWQTLQSPLKQLESEPFLNKPPLIETAVNEAKVESTQKNHSDNFNKYDDSQDINNIASVSESRVLDTDNQVSTMINNIYQSTSSETAKIVDKQKSEVFHEEVKITSITHSAEKIAIENDELHILDVIRQIDIDTTINYFYTLFQDFFSVQLSQFDYKELDRRIENIELNSTHAFFIIFLVFIAMVWVFRKQDLKNNVVDSENFTELNSDDLNVYQSEKTNSQNYNECTDNKDNQSHFRVKRVVESDTGSIENEVNIKKFINTDFKQSSYKESSSMEKGSQDPSLKQTVAKHSDHKKNVLESAFNPDEFSNGRGFILDDPIDNKTSSRSEQILNDDSVVNNENLLDSVEEIRFINEKTRESKVKAFINATSFDAFSDETLKAEFKKIQDNEKIDVFIEEFEHIMSGLSEQTPVIQNQPEQIDHLVQFKLSIHFIKVLSEMMQAYQLKQFSNTIIDYLEEIIEGRNHLNSDASERLTTVVALYHSYIRGVKSNKGYKIKV